MDRRAWVASAPSVLLLAACATTPANAPVARDLHLDLTLASGERVAGSSADCEISLYADGGRTTIPLSSVRAIAWNEDKETVTVRMPRGERRRGVLETESLQVLLPGATTPWDVPIANVRALSATPRIRIAGSGDAWWDLSSVSARGFDLVNEGGRLTVENIDPEVTNRGSNGPWSTVRLARDTEALADFVLAADLAWDADGAGARAMQNLYVTLIDDAGREIVCAGHHDAWDRTTGSRYSRLGGVARESGYGTQPAEGCAELRIVRTDGVLRVLWNGCETRSGESRAPVARVVVQSDFYAYRGVDGESVFGTATIERLEIR